MSTEPTKTEKTPAEVLADVLKQVEAKTLEVRGPEAETQRKIADAKADLEYLDLVQRFNALGKQDEKYTIVDVTAHGKGFVVLVANPRAEVHKKTLSHLAGKDEVTDAKLLEITREYVKHPELDVFDAMIAEVPDVQDVCFMAVKSLWGARARIRLAK